MPIVITYREKKRCSQCRFINADFPTPLKNRFITRRGQKSTYHRGISYEHVEAGTLLYWSLQHSVLFPQVSLFLDR